mmetsp:Transcript_1363/g.4738  ORF Transcript_1363/g.4738 Transcript_1363/m.4738 type:complete len:220 (-) Transcript_1363:250-909(-)
MSQAQAPLGTHLANVLTGLLSSSCCALQLLVNLLNSLNILHVGCVGFNKYLGPVRSEVRSVTVVWLGILWILTLRNGWGKRRVMLSTLCAVVLAVLPEILLQLPRIFPLLSDSVPAVAAPTRDSVELLLHVGGMGCEACQHHIQNILQQTSGVLDFFVDFRTGDAQVTVANDWGFNITALTKKLQDHGYELAAYDSNGSLSRTGLDVNNEKEGALREEL